MFEVVRLSAGDLRFTVGNYVVGVERKTWGDLIGACRQRQNGGMRFLQQVNRQLALYDISVVLMDGGYRVRDMEDGVYDKQGNVELDTFGTNLGGITIWDRQNREWRAVAPSGLYTADAALLRAQEMGAFVVHNPEPELLGPRVHYLVNYFKAHGEEFVNARNLAEQRRGTG